MVKFKDNGFTIINSSGLIEVEFTEYEHPYTGKPLAQIQWITVDEQGVGLGGELYRQAREVAREHGYHLASDDDLSENALGFWRAQVQRGRAEEFLFDPEEGPLDQEFDPDFDPAIFIMD